MFSKALTAVVLAGVALAQTFSINTPPSIQQCQPASLSWVGGTGPYILSAIPQGQVSAQALATIASSVTGTTYSWTVNIAQGTAITIRISDSTGALAYSSGLTVQAGSSGCLGSSASGGAASTSGAAASGSSSAAATTSSGAAASTTSAAASTTTTTSRSASSASTTSAASTTTTTSSAAAAASSTSKAAGLSKAEFNLPVLALAGVAGFAVLGGAVALF